jgi:catechol 2,3-dioxygenase-like lactoylglutathione lyase family enzyme
MTPHRIGRLHHVIMDCPDPAALAMFYAELLGLPITWQEDSRSTLTSWSMTSKRPEGTSWPLVLGGCRAEMAAHRYTQIRPGILSA